MGERITVGSVKRPDEHPAAARSSALPQLLLFFLDRGRRKKSAAESRPEPRIDRREEEAPTGRRGEPGYFGLGSSKRQRVP
ncbi:hypothetical protein KM043_012591 [Ampulex compressa]|nr:hypothetical protein KM043_012591 [Ampulex compressa]